MLIRMQNPKRLIKTRRVMREYVMVLNCNVLFLYYESCLLHLLKEREP